MYNLYQGCYSAPLSYDLTTFFTLGSRAEICQIFHWFFGKSMTPKRHSEIN